MLDFENCFVKEKVWEDRVDINHAVGIFYSLELLYGLILKNYTPFLPSNEKLFADIKKYRDIWIKKLAQIIYDYIVVIVGAELRHSYECSEYYHPDFFGGGWLKNMSRNECFEDRTFDPDFILRLGENLFDEKKNGWRLGFGGEKWYNIAKAGLMHGKTPDVIFVDHTVDLSHNNSVFFDKGGGIVYCNIGEYKRMLDRKFHMVDFFDLLSFIRWHEKLDSNLMELVKRYNVLIENDQYLLPTYSCGYVNILNEKTWCFLHYKPQKFGNKKLNISDIIPTGRVLDCGEEISYENDKDEEDW